MKLTTFAKLLSCNINITKKYYYENDESTDYHVEFSPFVEFLTQEGGSILHCICGIGDTEQKALQDFVNEIYNYKIVVSNAYGKNRKEIKLTDGEIEIDI